MTTERRRVTAVRLSRWERAAIDRAATLRGMSRGRFIREAALAAGQKTQAR